MKRVLKGLILAYLLMGLFILVACGQPATGTESVTSLQITRSSSVKNNTFPEFTRTIQDSVKATQLYGAIQQLPAQKGVFCPLDTGLQYDLFFTRKGEAKIHILLTASGCRSAVLNSNDRRATDDTFWSLIAQTVGVTTNDIFVKPA